MNHIYDYLLLLAICLVLISGSKSNPALSAFHLLNITIILIWVAAKLELSYLNSSIIIFIIVIVILYSILNLNLIKIRFLFINIVTLTFYKLITFRNVELSFRFHSNSDPYGWANASAYLKDNFSFKFLLNEYLKVTGFDNFVWLSPSPLLTSPYAIPDQQLRYSAEVVLAAGRPGFPLLFGQILQIFSDPVIFFKLFLILGIVLSVILFYFTYDLIINIADTNSTKNKTLNLAIYAFLYISQGWLLLMVLEGQTPQIWTLCASVVFTTYLIRLLYKRIVPISTLLFPIFLTLTCVSIAYPQTLINIVMIITLILIQEVVLFFFSKNTLSLELGLSCIVIISYILALIYASNIMNDAVLSYIRSNWGGGGIHIGFNKFFELFLPLPNNSLNIFEPSFSSISNNNLFSKISLLSALIVQISLFKFSSKSNSLNIFTNLISIINGLVCLLYLYAPVLNKSIILNDYVFFRFQIQFIIFWIPAIGVNLYLINTRYKLFSFNKIYVRIIAIVLSLSSFLSISSNYVAYSLPGHPVKCPHINLDKSIYYFSDDYFINTLSFGICGEFKNLSDGNVPIFRIIKAGSEFRYIDPNTLRIGKTYILKQDLENVLAPCFTQCVMNLLKVQ